MNKYIYVSNAEFFEKSALKQPINTLDHKLEECYPEFYSLHYDLRLLINKVPVAKEEMPIHDNYKRWGSLEISSFDEKIRETLPKSILLCGFDQEQFQYVAPQIKDTAEIIFFFKCPRIKDMSLLSQFINLKCVHIYWNNALERLWDMKENKQLKVISCMSISKLRDIDALKDSGVEYLYLNSESTLGGRKPMLFDPVVIGQMKKLKHLTLVYKDYVARA